MMMVIQTHKKVDLQTQKVDLSTKLWPWSYAYAWKVLWPYLHFEHVEVKKFTSALQVIIIDSMGVKWVYRKTNREV